MQHLNRPDGSFNAETEEKIPMRFVVQSIGEWSLNSSRLSYIADENYFRLYGLFSSQQNDYYARLGEIFQIGGFHLGATQSVSFQNQAKITVYGVNFGVRWDQIKIEIQYNLPRNVPNKIFSPSVFELAATFKLLTKNRAVFSNALKEINTDGY